LTDIDEWDHKFMEVDQEMLFDIILVFYCCIDFGLPLFSDPFMIGCVMILPIIKPVSSKFQTSSSRMPYFALVYSTGLNQLLIRTASSHRTLCLSYA
jgi:hypothetical protein